MVLGLGFIYTSCLALFMGLAITNGDAYRIHNKVPINYQTIYVDPSGHGNFSTIQSAINSVPSNNQRWICIYITAGTYNEQVNIPMDKQFIYLKGEGKWKTRVVWGASDSIATSATVTVNADNFVAKSLTFVNSYNYPVVTPANPRKPALAAMIVGDKCSFYRCGFIGLQDTLWDVQGRHYFYRSSIVGAVDFIFGAGQSLYERCTIDVTAAPLSTLGFITAQGRSSPNDANGFVFKECNVIGTGQTYLGRPWREYARVLFYNSTLSNVIVPEGWNAWYSTGREHQLTFAEHNCNGVGSNTEGRVPWESKLSLYELQNLTSMSFIDNEGWISGQIFNMLG